MEKTDLYYIVVKGTNERVLTGDKIPLIVQPSFIEITLDKCKELIKRSDEVTYECEEISIEEYERVFTEVEEW